VPQLLESLIKGCLDPNIPFAIRDRLIGGVTGLLHEIIRLYPTVGFNTQSQRLAVGTAATSAGGGKSGQIVIWDLKTATRLQVIDAHVPHPISAVSFNRLQTNGSHELLLVSYAATENLVKVWQQPSGLFGTLVSAFSAVSEGEHRRLPSGGNSGGLLANIVSGGSFKMFRSFVVDSAAGATDIPARFEWSSDRSVKLIRPAPASSLIFTV
jgi:WD40 repeat protein